VDFASRGMTADSSATVTRHGGFFGMCCVEFRGSPGRGSLLD
jgi:hypothetical protein